MPYVLVGNCVHKKNADGSAGETVPGGCHDNPEEAKKHMRALYANVESSEVSELSMVVTKASYDKSEPDPNKKRRIQLVNSDTALDSYAEQMSVDLFKDFTNRIEKSDPIPDVFKSVVCEDGVWCGGMPYLSIAHYRAGQNSKNVPGVVESVYVDGVKLKSKAYLFDNNLGRKLFDALCDDLEKHKSNVTDHKPVRVSIGFLDLEHTHEVQGKSVTFTRTSLGQKCALCESGAGGKIYKKGILVHLAATRVPVNRRTEMTLEEKSMGDIITKHDDAASIIGEELAGELEQKSIADDVLVVKADGTEVTNTPVPEPIKDCYDPNTDSFDQKCVNVKMMQYMVDMRNEMHTVKSEAKDEASTPVEKLSQATEPVVEESMDKNKMHEDMETPEEDKKEKEEETKKSEVVEVSPLDTQFNTLKSMLAEGKSLAEVQEVFNALGKEVEKSLTPKSETTPADADIVSVVKSAIEQALTPIRVDIAALKASQGTVQKSTSDVPASRGLTLRPNELVQNSAVTNPQLSQIQQIARKSVYGS